MNYYERHLGDYARDAGHLTMLEHGAYTLLLDRCYTTEAGIPADKVHRICRARTRDEKAAVDAVLDEFFTLADGVHLQKRVTQEIERYRETEPDREAKRENERERQRRTRERRKELFDTLRGHGIVPAYDAPMSELLQLASRMKSQPVTPPVTRDATATQTPDTRHQEEPIPSLLSQAPAFPPENRRDDPPPLALVAPPSKPASLPDCPHQAVLSLWAEVLPSMPQHNPAMWRGARADHLRARWRETAAEKRWTAEADGLAYLRKLFGYVAQSAFLTGRIPAREPGRSPFLIELEWLVNPTNWARVIEGKYHQTEAA